jgi:hypothetical protein
METERRRQLLLAVVAIVLALVAYQAWPRTSAAPSAASNGRRAAAPAATATATAGTTAMNTAAEQGAPDVHLEALDAQRPKPRTADRNLFKFKPKAPPPPPSPPPAPPRSEQPAMPAGPPPPPPLPAITLKFIGLAEQGPGKPKVAVLSDGIGPPFVGREGDIIAGRYRILKIGVESIEMAYLDGRGRQTIRLTGS